MIDLSAIEAKLDAPNGFGCEKECGREDVVALLATTVALRDALRGVIAVGARIMWCDRAHAGSDKPCGECAGCLAWQAAQDALAMDGEVGDGR